jgi:hypothetical protein
MEDFKVCPICNEKMRALNKIKLLVNNVSMLTTERVCANGVTHCLQTFSKDNELLILKVSLNNKFTKFITINYATGKSVIGCWKEGKNSPILIDKILDVDFPSLEKLKSKIDLYIAFS